MPPHLPDCPTVSGEGGKQPGDRGGIMPPLPPTSLPASGGPKGQLGGRGDSMSPLPPASLPASGGPFGGERLLEPSRAVQWSRKTACCFKFASTAAFSGRHKGRHE